MATLTKDPASLAGENRPLWRMFASVPKKYDLLNRLLTGRMDEKWRKRAARSCLENKPRRVLDLCTGTGDLVLRLAREAAKEVEIVAADFSKPMLAVASDKAARAQLTDRIRFVEADVAQLPFANGHFDAVGIAFAFRNLTYANPLRGRYLQELSRIVAPGGRCVIIETSQPRSRLWRASFHFYLRTITAPVGGWVSGHRAAYRYLAHSARNYLRPQEVSRLLTEAGFSQVEFKSLLGGLAALHIATK